jgi:tetratricopeptide (TPR) repeat protein
MLETIREFALEQLDEEGDAGATARRHAEHFLALTVRAEPHLTADDQREWLDRCEVESPNIRAALRWTIDADWTGPAQESAGAMWRFWQQRGHIAEGHAWFEEVLAMPTGRGPTRDRAKALLGAGGIAWWQGDREASRRFYEEAVAIERRRADPARLAEALYNLSFVAAGEDTDAATRLLEESIGLFRRCGDERGVAQVLTMLVIRDAETGDWDRVAGGLEEVVGIWRRVGDRLHLAFDLVWLAFAYGRMGRSVAARSIALESLELFREADNATGAGIAFTDLAFLAMWEGRHRDAVVLAAASESLRQRVGGPPGGFAGILDGDVRAEAGAHLSEGEADTAWEEGLAMSVEDAAAVARGGTETS